MVETPSPLRGPSDSIFNLLQHPNISKYRGTYVMPNCCRKKSSRLMSLMKSDKLEPFQSVPGVPKKWFLFQTLIFLLLEVQ